MPTMLLIAITHWLSAITSTSVEATASVLSDFLIGIVVVLVILLLVIGGGALVTLLTARVSSFLNHNVPSAEALASFQASYTAQLMKKRNKMVEKKQPTDDVDLEEDELEDSGGTYTLLARGSRYVALLAAWIATCGSLFFSEALGWIPCLLCWYQRILMYPLALILAVGILRKDKGIYKYALVLSIPGACVSLLHYLDQKTTLFRGMVPCTVGVPCSSDYLNWFGGVVTIPFLALIAFLIITFCMVATRLGDTGEEETTSADENAPQRSRVREALPVFAIIGVVVIAFLVAVVAVKSGVAIAATDPATVTVAPLPTVDAAALAGGKTLYEQSCAACHGMKGEGTAAGRPLTNSTLVKTSTATDLVKFVRVGRSASDPHNTTGLVMPAAGGQPAYTDADIAAVIAYIRQLAGANPLSK